MRWIVLVFFLVPTTAQAQFYGGHSSKYLVARGGFGGVGGFGGYRVPYHFRYGTPFYQPFGYVAPFYAGPFYSVAPPIFYSPPQPLIQIHVVPQQVTPARFDSDIPKDIDLDEFIVVRPKNKNIPRMPAPELLPPLPKVPDLRIQPAELALEPKRNEDPRVEANRQLEIGKNAMATGEFGRALYRFNEAVRTAPKVASGYFHRAQAEFALGKYREAVSSIVEGLKLRPDWSSARFQARELYGNNLGVFDFHLQELKNALDQRPDDPALLFLYGYQLWFDVRRREATPILEKAIERSLNPDPIQSFLLGGLMVRAK